MFSKVVIVCATLVVVRGGNLGYVNQPVSQYNQAATLGPRSLAYTNSHVNLGWNPSGAPQLPYSGYVSPVSYAGSLASPNHVLHNSPLPYSGLAPRPSSPLSHLNSPHINLSYNIGSLGHSGLVPSAGPFAQSAPVSRGPLVHATSQVNAVSLFQSSPLNYGGYAQGHNQHMNNYYSHPKYQYSYSVEDPHTGDHKSQHEARVGDVVKGGYSLLQPDGSFRKVSYSADDHNGFNAIVQNSGPNHHVYSAQYHH
ncbi:unnamed protein product [Danaus chrysippus]|uniref:(African queen) hypothetical protein n=1 Tax=Danaus chrysippus TaxID=151541 RepID=A0A8J2QFW9_9NEOP|nr:unnamed protein product [Danaus chrysippus]